jgi:Ion channel
LSNLELYATGMYATITFIVTVGYGDILAVNYIERIVAMFFMQIGVIGFSFLQGQFVSIIVSYDEVCADHLYQMNVLREVQERYNVGHDLFYEMVRSLKYSRVKKSQRIQQFINELPYRLQVELEKEMHFSLYNIVTFFKNKDIAFINWIGLLLRP